MSNEKKPRQRAVDDATRQAAWDELVRLQIRGASLKVCAEKLGFHINTVSKWIRSEEYKIKLMRTRALVFQRTQDAGDAEAEQAMQDVRTRINKYADEAIEQIHQMMYTGEHERHRLKAAIDLADRSRETQKTKQIETRGQLMVFTPEGLALAAAAAKEIQTDHRLGKVVKPVELDTSMIELVVEE